MIGPAFTDAIAFARNLHADAHCEATGIPRFAHALATSALVLANRGAEIDATGALVLDCASDAVRKRFGDAVASILEAKHGKERHRGTWREGRAAQLRRLARSVPSPGVLRVLTADALQSTSAIVAAVRCEGASVWARLEAGRAADQLWYLRELADLLLASNPGTLAESLDREVRAMAILATGAPADGPIRLWLDDGLLGGAPDGGWLPVATAWEANALLATGRVTALYLGREGGRGDDNGSGEDVVRWLCAAAHERGPIFWPADGITLHTANPPFDAMEQALVHAARDVGSRVSVTGSAQRKLSFSAPTVAGHVRDEYQATIVEIRLPSGNQAVECGHALPAQLSAAGDFHVISAANPGLESLTPAMNATRHTRLLDVLDRIPAIWRADAVGHDRDESYHERSVAVWGLSRDQAVDIARRFGQWAIFAGEPSRGLYVMRC